MFSAVAKSNGCGGAPIHSFPPKKSHNISLHTNTLDSNLDKNYTRLHSSNQTHNYSTNPTTYFKEDPVSIALFFDLLLKLKNYLAPYFYI